MTIRTYFLILCATLCFSSCKLGPIAMENRPYAVLPHLGVIGFGKNGVFSNSFRSMGAPLLKDNIKLIFQKKKMTKGGQKRLRLQALKKEDTLQSSDSISSNSFYYSVLIADQVGFLGQVNSPYNNEIRNYLLATQNGVLITSVDIHFSTEQANSINQAQDIYLISKNPGSYAMEIWKEDGSRDLINFSDGVILGYNYSAFCWSQDARKEPVISALRDPDKACPGRTVKNPENLEREDLFESLR